MDYTHQLSQFFDFKKFGSADFVLPTPSQCKSFRDILATTVRLSTSTWAEKEREAYLSEANVQSTPDTMKHELLKCLMLTDHHEALFRFLEMAETHEMNEADIRSVLSQAPSCDEATVYWWDGKTEAAQYLDEQTWLWSNDPEMMAIDAMNDS